ncbi:uncharacterized protein EI97DRAFT_491838 [Westerdykella ornata]|uniref:Nuclear protein DGCR14 n=1 Tax=Westerdykella ornata TaxID=318751 RepID=A0A6A6JXH6_WESOR|nr:uncharacterized protein EI97DRAFT_491838 [Westerdykella ornata]KAF2280436.1 hypothetical protein EI97DRAFT_491838 [Westerdykella ornata]
MPSTSPPSSTSQAVTKRPASSLALMPPPPAPKRIKRPTTVLDEDTYTSAISHIIRRDFFPGLAETDAQHEYLDALESRNNEWIREAGERLVGVMTPAHSGGVGMRRKVAGTSRFRTPAGVRVGGGGGDTPSVWGADTPVSIPGTAAGDDNEDDESNNTKPHVDLNLSLNAFQAKYTSEDQESFSRIIDRQNAKKFAANEWLRTGNRYASKQRLAQQKVLQAAAERQHSESSTSMEVAVRPSQDLDKRPAAPTTHKHTPFNALMFPPESIEAWAPTRAQRAEEASLAPPKAVLHHNTRLPPEVTDPPSPLPTARPSSPTFSAARDAIRGRPRLSASEVGYEGSETPRVNGYAFVEARAPSPSPEEAGPAPTDLLERLGVSGKGAAEGGRTFAFKEVDRREKLHLKMVEKINAKGRRDTGSAGVSGLGGGGMGGAMTPRFLSAPTPGGAKVLGSGAGTPAVGVGGRKNLGNLTPAAQRLLERVGGRTPRRYMMDLIFQNSHYESRWEDSRGGELGMPCVPSNAGFLPSCSRDCIM